MEQSQVCQWCLSEIIWDEETGPESHCPHCDNELSGYRSMKIGIDKDGDAQSRELDEEEEWEEDSEGQEQDTSWMDESEGFRGGSRSMLAAEGVVQRILDQQLEVPECPACREYMIEAGVQTIGGEGFVPTVSPAIGISIVPSPFKLQWYVCPACHHTASFLSVSDREEMIERLAERS
ncbi:hypothetical protein ACFQZE_10630 [Paenibacillus sp. GCM10027627]|uniref:hypothetical protein n=1 Tax=unclassified Paenibacillus TaxID=185978 RepID=UPI0036300DFA